MTARIAIAGILVLLAGCSDGLGNTSKFGPSGSFQVINGASAAGSVTLYADGRNYGSIDVGEQHINGGFPAGHHQIELRLSNGSVGLSRQIDLAEKGKLLIIALDSAGVLGSADLSDTNSVVPAGATKLRVAHYASAAAPIDIWRTQPDFGTPIRVQFPFNYQDVSPYLQSTVGDWQVFVSTPVVNPGDPLPDTLGMTSLFPVPEFGSRTVVVVDDAAGGVVLYVLNP